jgi:hypothetical protein
MRVVMNDHIAFAERVERDFLRDRLHNERHATDHGRAELGAGEEVAVAIRQRAREVETLIENRRVGGLHHGDAHLAAYGHHGAVDDVHRDNITAGRRGGVSEIEGQWRRRAALVPACGPGYAPVRAEYRGASVPLNVDAVAENQLPAICTLDVLLDVKAAFSQLHYGLQRLCCRGIRFFLMDQDVTEVVDLGLVCAA